jgi:ribosome-binding factor A
MSKNTFILSPLAFYLSSKTPCSALCYLNMESKRQQKFAGVIQQDLAAIFQREGMNFLPNTLVTITKVRVTPDLAIARVFLSFFNNSNTQLALNTIKSHASEIRYKLGARIKDQVRIIPQLEFFVDDTNEYVERMDKIFDKISKEERQQDDE